MKNYGFGRIVGLLSLMTLVLAAPAVGQEDCRLAGNLVENCGFVFDLDGWELFLGTFSLEPEGYASRGSARGLVEDTGIGAQVANIEQCVPVDDSAGQLRAVGHIQVSQTAGCTLSVFGHQNLDCSRSSSTSLVLDETVVDTFTWQRFEGDWVPNDRTVAAQIRVECFSTDPALEVWFDDIYFGPEPVPETPVTDIPTMSETGMALLAALLAIGGWLALRRTAG